MEPPDMPTPFVAGQAGLASGPHSTYRPADRGAPTARNVMAIRRRRDLAAPDRSVGCGRYTRSTPALGALTGTSALCSGDRSGQSN